MSDDVPKERTMEGTVNAVIEGIDEAATEARPAPEQMSPGRRRLAGPPRPAFPRETPASPGGERGRRAESPDPLAADPAPAATVAPMPTQKQAVAIERTMMPSMVASALGMDAYFNVAGYRAFLDKVRADAGNPTDPVEVMMLEQLVLAHFRSAQLQAQAGMADGLEEAKLYNAAAARLLSEFRLTALSLAAYRRTRQGG
jgi:hypothetical protein